MDISNVMGRLRDLADISVKTSQASFAITPSHALGIRIPEIRKLARETGKDHALSVSLWETGIHEARMLAAFIGDPAKVSRAQMEQWVKDFDSWDICDQTCSALFDKTPYAYQCAAEWAVRPEEFVKRAGFAMMAALAVHDKKADDVSFENFFQAIIVASDDGRNFVKKAVNWALRQIGKRNMHLHGKALQTAHMLAKSEHASARWIASDAIRELSAGRTLERITARESK